MKSKYTIHKIKQDAIFHRRKINDVLSQIKV